jgi:2',3'-cyclic-nucleotide 2'-phosphodiesterase (5'-nucleotidase family)
MRIRILHTNDIHSRLENFARITTKINELRDEHTLVLDAGDFHDFMRLELQGTKGKAGSELLNEACYDCIAIGNNEGFEGIEILENIAEGSATKFLSCNLYKFDSFKGELNIIKDIRRSTIINRSGIRFLIIGTSPFGSYNEFYNLLNMHSTDAIPEIKKELEINKGNYDICILLSHCGMKEDTEIANNVQGIDIIINGHSHILMEKPEVINNTVIHMSGSYGEHIGLLDIEYDGGIKSFEGKNISVGDALEDANIINKIKSNKSIAIRNLSKTMYEIEADLWHDVVEENPMTNLLADALVDLLDCEIGIINSGVINGGIKKGKVSKKKLLEICPSPLNPTIIEIQGKYIIEAFRESLNAEYCMSDGKGSGFRGKYVGRLHISGGYIEYSDTGVEKIYINNLEIDEERVYRVATSDYLQRGTAYESLKYNKLIKYNAEYLRDTLKDYLRKEEFVFKALKDRYIKVS